MKRIIVIAFCIVLIGLSGCKRHVDDVAPEETTRSVEATVPSSEQTRSAPATDAAPTGVYSPAPDDAVYAAILAGIADYLRDDDLVVQQLKVEDGTAIADVEAAPALSGWRSFIALVRNGETWAVTFSADGFDSTPEFKETWFPGMSSELLGSIQWTRARTSLEDAARTHAISEAATQGGFSRNDLEASALKLARTAGHEWWASCTVSHKDGSVDPLSVYMRWRADGDGWETFDCGTGIEPGNDPRFPSDVADLL